MEGGSRGFYRGREQRQAGGFRCSGSCPNVQATLTVGTWGGPLVDISMFEFSGARAFAISRCVKSFEFDFRPRFNKFI